MRILITGANGFIGKALCEYLEMAGHNIVPAVRYPCGMVNEVCVGNIDGETDWQSALTGCKTVVHLAARVHAMDQSLSDPLTQYRKVNVDGTLNLARQAVSAKVKRFIYISSIKVNGEASPPGHPFTAKDIPAPVGPYAVSKYEAEAGLQKIAQKTGLGVVVIRPPLVYGPGVKANFLNMMQWVSKGIPLPFGAIHSKRSLVALDNLVDLILACVVHPDAPNHVFLVRDGEDLTVSGLIKSIAEAMGQPSRLIPLPQSMVELVLKILGKSVVTQRLCRSLQIDMTDTQKILGWVPPVQIDDALIKTVAAVNLR